MNLNDNVLVIRNMTNYPMFYDMTAVFQRLCDENRFMAHVDKYLIVEYPETFCIYRIIFGMNEQYEESETTGVVECNTFSKREVYNEIIDSVNSKKDEVLINKIDLLLYILHKDEPMNNIKLYERLKRKNPWLLLYGIVDIDESKIVTAEASALDENKELAKKLFGEVRICVSVLGN